MVSLSHLGEMSDVEDEVDLKKHAENSMFLMETFKRLEKQMEYVNVSDELLPISLLYEFFEKSGVGISYTSCTSQRTL